MGNCFYKLIHLIFDYLVQFYLLVISYILGKKILVIARPYGRWGNRLMLFAYIQCWAKKNNCVIFNPHSMSMHIILKIFKNKVAWIPENKIIIFIFSMISKVVIQSLIRSTYRRYILPNLWKVDLENDHENFSENLIKKRYLILELFYFTDFFSDKEISK